MSLIVNGTEITDLFVIDKQGNRVEIETLKDQLGNIIFEKSSGGDCIIGITLLDVSVVPTIKLGVFKLDENPNKIDWGDGTIETLSPTSTGTLGDYTYGTVSHTYTANGDYDIKISGSGSIFLGTKPTTGDELTDGYRTGLYGYIDVNGKENGSGAAQGYAPVRYYKIGEICKVLGCPFGRSLGLVQPPEHLQSISCSYFESHKPYVFTSGVNIPNCYYHPSLKFVGMWREVNKVLYENADVKYDFLGGFEGDGCLLLTETGSAFNTQNIKNYPFTGIGYIKINANAIVEFPSTLTSVQGEAWSWGGGGATLKFYTPSGVSVDLPSGFANSKTAYSVTIYTDNEDIRNYDWAGDNITVTFYHLNGTAW